MADYFEDVDPRFAEPTDNNASTGQIPASLMPGGAASSNPNLLSVGGSTPSPNGNDAVLRRDPSYEDMQDGSRSPAASEASHFTSVSQRGVNPNWRPPPSGAGGPPLPGQYGQHSGRRPPRQEDVILDANAINPDFAVPGAGLGRGRGGVRGGRGGRGGIAPPPMMGMGSQGRYPGANAI